MNKNSYLFFALSIFSLFVMAETSFGDDKPVWMTSASYELRLSARDKFSVDPTFKVKYIVKMAPDLIFIAEREGIARDSRSAAVIFPDDFSIPETGEKAWIDSDGRECTWEIYVNNVLEDTGTISFVGTTMRIYKEK